MIKVEIVQQYTPELGAAARALVMELSRSGKDKGEIPQAWFDETIASPYHDLIVATEDGAILGMATVSVMFGAEIRKQVYLNDFVVSSAARGKGVGGLIWDKILAWGKEHDCNMLKFDSGRDREAAQNFYLHRGAEIYKTNFFRKKLD